MKRLTVSLVAWLAFASTAVAQVTAVVTGPKDSLPGDLVVLDASGSTASAFRWVLLGSKKTYLTFDGGKRLVFASGQPGEYTFILVTAGQGQGGALEVATAEHVVAIGGPVVVPAPKPVPTPEPKPVDPPEVPRKLRAVLFYEKSRHAVPRAVAQAISEANVDLSRTPFVEALMLDHDVEPLPANLVPLRDEARRIGLPALVVADWVSNTILRSVRNPTQASQIEEALR